MTLETPGKSLSQQEKIWLGIGLGFAVFWVFLFRNNPFFWDTILNSRIAHWYLDTNFSSLTIPESLDAGHPPFFSLYLAVGWKMFGKSLPVAHFMMLPFLLGIVWQYFQLARRLLPAKVLPLAMILLIAEPTLLAQSTMMSADLVLLFGFLMAFNAVLSQKKMWLAIALIVMASVNMRGIMGCGLVFLVDFAVDWRANKKLNPKLILPYLPAAMLTAIWLYVHHQAVGWWVSPPAETYGGHREMVGVAGMAKNFAIAGWRIADYGRIFIWAILFWGTIQWFRKKWDQGRDAAALVGVTWIPVAGYIALFILFSNPIGPRYFLIGYLTGSLLFLRYLASFSSPKKTLIFTILAVFILISGHFWVYPDKIAKPWDASLAHLPYFKLRSEMNAYVQANEIPLADTYTYFPNIHGDKYSDLKEKDWKYGDIQETELTKMPFVIQSNVFNGFSDSELVDLRENWELVKEFRSCQVYIRLYKNPVSGN